MLYALLSFSFFSGVQNVAFSAALAAWDEKTVTVGPGPPETLVFKWVFINKGDAYDSKTGTESLNLLALLI